METGRSSRDGGSKRSRSDRHDDSRDYPRSERSIESHGGRRDRMYDNRETRDRKRKRNVRDIDEERRDDEFERDRRSDRDNDLPEWKKIELEKRKKHEERLSEHRERKKRRALDISKTQDTKKAKRRRIRKKNKRPEEEFEGIDSEYIEAMNALDLPKGFSSSKNTQVVGNEVGSARIGSFRNYRQYMNRRGGFNRDLEKSF